MNSQQIQKSSSDHSASFDDVSKLFSLPLSEAADILGVSTVVLKKMCNDNGLERWPHRKYLAGKSIEEIKKEAAREKSKALAISPVDRHSNSVTIGSASASQIKDKAIRSPQEMSKLNGQQQHGSRSVFTVRPHQDMLASNFPVETSTCLDEFKYGFPSDGLSTSSNKWWGSGSAADPDKSESDALVKSESNSSFNGGVKGEGSMQGSDSSSEQIVSLSSIRQRALEEGRDALRFGFWKEFGAEKVGKKEKLLLSRIIG